MSMLASSLRAALTAGAIALFAGTAAAQDFHGFSATGFSGDMLSAENFAAAVVTDAMAKTPPRNGEKVRARLRQSRSRHHLLRQGRGRHQEERRGGRHRARHRRQQPRRRDRAHQRRELYQPQRRLRHRIPDRRQFRRDHHAEDERRRHQGDGDRHPDAAARPSSAPTTRSPATWAASISARRRSTKFGADKVKEGYFILGELPQSGAVPAMRTGGQRRASSPRSKVFPKTTSSVIDTKNTLEESFAQTNNRARPHSGRRADHGDGDQRPVDDRHSPRREAGGREADLIVVGMGADETRDAGRRAGLRRLGRIFPGALRQFPRPDGARRARRHRPAADRAADPCHGQQGQRLRILSRLQMLRRQGNRADHSRRRSSWSTWRTHPGGSRR